MLITLTEMSSLATALVDSDDAVERCEQELKRLKERSRQLREETIPAAMQELGLEEIKLSTGQKLKVKQDVYASIPTSQKGAAFDWLEQNGFGGLIKCSVSTNFARGELDRAEELLLSLSDQGYVAELDQSVHAQTLKAFLREQLAAGTNIPMDLFGARPVWTATISNK